MREAPAAHAEPRATRRNGAGMSDNSAASTYGVQLGRWHQRNMSPRNLAGASESGTAGINLIDKHIKL